MKRIVVIGGGTGTFTTLSGLRKCTPEVALSAIVTMADSGGSTGRLRDEFGYLPVGDVRMALAALAEGVDDHQQLVRELFLHRFSKGNGLSGHNFGNLLLVALTDILGSETEAIKVAARLLHTKGDVIPVTTEQVDLVAEYDDGVVVEGETNIDEPRQGRDSHRITTLRVTPSCAINPEAKKALAEADLIVLGPGDLYTSVLAACVVDGMKEAIIQTPAKVAFVLNLMSKYGQTTNMQASDYLTEIERYTGRVPDYVLVNNAPMPEELLKKYASEAEYPVADDFGNRKEIIRNNLLMEEVVHTKEGDALRRSLIRHDPDKLASALTHLP